MKLTGKDGKIMVDGKVVARATAWSINIDIIGRAKPKSIEMKAQTKEVNRG